MLWSHSLMSSGRDKWKRLSSFWKLLMSSMSFDGSSGAPEASVFVQLGEF